ncbi:MAG TPA: hypothetical protein VK603_16540 [Candidatus Saccharimonadales bacterium]|jgi:hypothetical protein|nr:hypothetical protein [Candidatus Saccharimonadales bacterium]HTF62021.1 hypothetical protein [Edaphobacter sp.]
MNQSLLSDSLISPFLGVRIDEARELTMPSFDGDADLVGLDAGIVFYLSQYILLYLLDRFSFRFGLRLP